MSVFHLGLIINPLAGLGGPAALKGSDGVAAEALARGAEPRAAERTRIALECLRPVAGRLQFVTCPGPMGADLLHELGFAEDGSMQVADRGWPEPYSPSIDQMMLNLAQQYGAHCGVIAFSGMGSDGSAAAAYVRRQGGVIWTQKADSCACPSMPDSLREGGYSALSGDPRELAAALVNHLAEQCQ